MWQSLHLLCYHIVWKKVDDDKSFPFKREELGQWMGSKCSSCSVSGLRGGVDQDQVIVPPAQKRKAPLSLSEMRRMFTGDKWTEAKFPIRMFRCSLDQHGMRKEGLRSSSCNALGKKWLMVLPVTHQLFQGAREGGMWGGVQKKTRRVGGLQYERKC